MHISMNNFFSIADDMKSEIIHHEEANTIMQDETIPGTKYIVFIMNKIVQYE